jgi:lipopolysaccharide export system protein LptC
MTASVVLFEGRASSLLDHDRTLTLEAARRHTASVRVLRVLLALAMAGVAASVGYYVVQSAINPPPEIEAAATTGEARMDNLRLSGLDSEGSPYVIRAESAERLDDNADVIELAFPQLDFTAEQTASSVVRADRGVYDQVASTLDLHDGVSFRTDTGYVFKTEQARVYVDEGRVAGEKMILGEGPTGSIRAQGFEITDDGDRVIFSGEVVARLYRDAPTSAPDLRGAADETDVGAGAPNAAASHAQISRQGGPIDISADATEFISSQNINRWIGHVDVRQGDSQLVADQMDIHFAQGDDRAAREIERIEATGSVAYVTPLEVARGDRGVYLTSTESITLTGDVTLIRGDSTLSGAELVIDPREGRSSLSRGGADRPDDDDRVRLVVGSQNSEDGERASSSDPE